MEAQVAKQISEVLTARREATWNIFHFMIGLVLTERDSNNLSPASSTTSKGNPIITVKCKPSLEASLPDYLKDTFRGYVSDLAYHSRRAQQKLNDIAH